MAQVLPPPSTIEEQASFQPDSLQRRNSAQSALYLETPDYSLARSHSSAPALNGPSFDIGTPSSVDDSPPQSPDNSRLALSRTSSFHSTPPSSVSLDMQYARTGDDQDDEDNDDDLQLPMFGDSNYSSKHARSAPPGSPNDHDGLPDQDDDDTSFTESSDAEALLAVPADDTQVRQEPSRQVDYLSHEWREEDIWESWKHIVSRRKFYGERSRLENASWRTWAKQKHRLRTVSPETLNWLKDCDVTWLYGPLQEGRHKAQTSEPPGRLSKSNSFLNKKPILKKRSVSEEMLQKSLSSSSLIKQAAAAVQAQRSSGGRLRPSNPSRLRRSMSDVDNIHLNTEAMSINLSSARTMSSTDPSGDHSPDQCNPRRHIRFDNKVEQCIAVDFKDFPVEDENNPEWARACSASESEDDDLPTIKTKTRKRSISSTPGSSRNSFSESNTGIAKLPSTTLKVQASEQDVSNVSRRPMLSPSPSQETIRAIPRKSADFMLADEDDEDELDWEPSGAFQSLRRDVLAPVNADRQEGALATTAAEEGLAAKGMRRTPSGMFMPLEESEDEDAQAGAGIFGRVVDTVNTARDIAYVLYNVGWRR